MKCSNCSKEIPDGKAFCGYCGATMAAEPEQVVTKKAPKDEAPTVLAPDISEAEVEATPDLKETKPKKMRAVKSDAIDEPAAPSKSFLVLAILSVVLGMIGAVSALVGFRTSSWLQLLGVVLPLVGGPLGLLGLKSRPRGIAIAGILINGPVALYSIFWILIQVGSLFL